MKKIDTGYIMVARIVFTSSLNDKPPLWFKLWIWLITEANHKEVKSNGQIFYRGQVLTSYEELREIGRYKIGWRWKKVSKTQISSFLDFLRKEVMITTKKTTRGLFINIVNYDYYQDPSKYEYNNEDNKNTTAKIQTSSTVNNNDKNEKKKIYIPNDNESSSSSFTSAGSVLADHSPLAYQETVKYSWQEKANRYAKNLGIDLENSSYKNKWFKIFKLASEGINTHSLETAYSYVKDHPKALTSDSRMKLFFWKYDYKESSS